MPWGHLRPHFHLVENALQFFLKPSDKYNSQYSLVTYFIISKALRDIEHPKKNHFHLSLNPFLLFCSHPTQKTSAHQHPMISCGYLIIVVKHSPRLCFFRLNLSYLASPQKLLSLKNISFFASTSQRLEIIHFTLFSGVPNQSWNS